MAEIPKKDWKKVVEESKGMSFFVPESALPLVKKWQELRDTLRKQTEVAAETEVKTQVAMQNMFLELREYAVKSGIEAPWSKDIGFDTQALNEGVYVVNIVDVLK